MLEALGSRPIWQELRERGKNGLRKGWGNRGQVMQGSVSQGVDLSSEGQTDTTERFKADE